MRKSAYKAGKIILKEGEVNVCAYILVEGLIEIVKKTDDGSEIVLGKINQNQMFGEMVMIDPTIPSLCSYKALTDCVVAIVPKESFQEKFQSVPKAVKSVIKVVSKRLIDTSQVVVDLHTKMMHLVEQRVGQTLEANEKLKQQLLLKDQKIKLLEAEVEKLKVSGPEPKKAKDNKQGQKLEKDRSMKLSLKDLDNIAMKQKKD